MAMGIAEGLGITAAVMKSGREIIFCLRELAMGVEKIVDKACHQVENLKCSRVKLTYTAREALNSVKEAADYGCQFVDCVDDFAWYCENESRISEVKSAIRNNDFGPLHDLLEQLKECLARAEEKYQDFKTACSEASRNSARAAEECQCNAIKARTKKKSTQIMGGVVAGLAVAAGATGGVAASVVAGVFTFGIGTIVGLSLTAAGSVAAGAAVGGGTVVVTAVLAHEYEDAARKFISLGKSYDELTESADRFFDEVRVLQRAVQRVGRAVDQVENSWHRHQTRESICNALDLLNERAKGLYSETSTTRNALKYKKETLEHKLSFY